MPAQDDFQKFTEWAKELFGDDEDTVSKFVNSAMGRKGYKPVTSWADPDPDEGGTDDGDFFGARRKARETRPVGEKTPPKKASGGGGFFQQY